MRYYVTTCIVFEIDISTPLFPGSFHLIWLNVLSPTVCHRTLKAASKALYPCYNKQWRKTICLREKKETRKLPMGSRSLYKNYNISNTVFVAQKTYRGQSCFDGLQQRAISQPQLSSHKTRYRVSFYEKWQLSLHLDIREKAVTQSKTV